jgi:hypothetical protein
VARPTKYTAEVVERITEAIGLGATYELAAAYGGISYDTFRTWRETKPAFFVALKEAEGEAAVRWLRRIEAAAEDDKHWQAAAWKLERRYPQDYGRTVATQEHTGAAGGPLRIVIETIDDRTIPAVEPH